MFSDRFVSDGFGSCRTVFGSFSNRSRIVLDCFGRLWYAFGPFSDDSTQNFKISNFNWPGLGPVRAVPSVRAVPPSPGQLKFEILRNFRKKTERKRKRKRNGIFVSQHLGDVVNSSQLACNLRFCGRATQDTHHGQLQSPSLYLKNNGRLTAVNGR